MYGSLGPMFRNSDPVGVLGMLSFNLPSEQSQVICLCRHFGMMPVNQMSNKLWSLALAAQ